ncbi:DUF998 domain-containing protein [Micromonospora sp. U21]|uniref:DUF998 domain-containing protein n=1 Tax=Micromonospora sp. U21 TaxID=2824899 RepID=UPI001B399D78|nr:DUF998 domain-containing protein [Micromonospora sp. U21]MBQ0906892.1 DUF998 domain-containing protein [Micromonospora sp. U21]
MTTGFASAAPKFATTSNPTTLLLLRCGVAAGPVFLAVGAAQGLARDGFDFGRNAISQLSLGAWGWIQVVNFVITAVLLIAGATGLRRALPDGSARRWAPPLVGAFGGTFLVAAIFPADPGAGFPDGPQAPATALSGPGAVHMVAASLGFMALCVAFVVLARPFAVAGHHGWALVCRIVPVVVLAGLAASSATVLAFTAGAAVALLCLSLVTARLSRR